jgi:hypothetical protein
MRREQFKNDGQTTLNGTISDSVTSVVVTDGSMFPAGGDFRILIDDELMLCTARSTNTLTVARAQEGTTNVSHADAALVNHVVSQGGLQSYLRDNDPLFDTDRPAFRIMDASQNRLMASDFTILNWGGTDLAATDTGRIIVVTGSVGGFITRPYPGGSTWTLTAAVRGLSTSAVAFWATASIGVLDSAGLGVFINYRSHEQAIHVNKWNNGSYTPPDIVGPFNVFATEWMWLRIVDPNDGNWHFQISDNGKQWLEVGSYGKTAYLGTPNRICFGTFSPAAGCYCTLAAWDDGAGILGS